MSHLAAAVGAVLPGAQDEGGGFHPPSIEEFFPAQLFGEGTIWGMTRINLIAMIMTAALLVFFIAAFRKPQLIPGKLQSIGEMAVDFVYVNVIDEVIGKKGRRFAPVLVTMFWMILFLNVAGVIPLLQIAPTSVIGVPLVLAIVSYAVFNWTGIKHSGFGPYMKMNLIPPGIPKPLLLLVVPIEFLSTFVLRPVTLSIRLMANMMAGHMLLVLFFSATSFFLFEADGIMKALGIVSYGAGFIFTLFELLVIVLQAYIFTLLTAVYIEGALSSEH